MAQLTYSNNKQQSINCHSARRGSSQNKVIPGQKVTQFKSSNNVAPNKRTRNI